MVFSAKICFKVIVGGVKIGEAIVFLIDPYYLVLPYLMIVDQCGKPLICITSKDFIQLQVPAQVMIKMFLDDSLHHTYNYVD